MERFNFTNPARTKVLLVPVGLTDEAAFHHYSNIVKTVTDIRLLDVAPNPRSRFFNPQEFPQGRVFYEYSTSSAEDDLSFLYDLEPWRKTFVIIGVCVHSPNDPLPQVLIDGLEECYSAAISHNIIVFHAPESPPSLPNAYWLTQKAEEIITSIETVLCGITSSFLESLDGYATSYESVSLRSPISLTDSSVLTRTINQAQKRLSSSSSLKVSFSNGQAVAPPKDLNLRFQQRQAGRQAKIMGGFFLLAGKANDAVLYFTDAVVNSYKADDNLWLASALECLAVAILILQFAGVSYLLSNMIPLSVLQLSKLKSHTVLANQSRFSTASSAPRGSGTFQSPRNSTSSSSSGSIPQNGHQTDYAQLSVIELLLLLTQRASHYYQSSTQDIDDCVPDLVYVESQLRSIKLMVKVYLSGSKDAATIIKSFIFKEPMEKSIDQEATFLPRQRIVHEIDKIFSLQISQLEIVQQCRVFCALASIYVDIGFYRKQALVLRLLIASLLPKLSISDEVAMEQSLGSMGSIGGIFLILFSIYGIDPPLDTIALISATQQTDWAQLQLLLIKICIRIAEVLRDYEMLSSLCTLTFARFTHCLSSDDQMKLKNRLLSLRSGHAHDRSTRKNPHPDPFLVRDARFIVHPRDTEFYPIVTNQAAVASDLAPRPLVFNPYDKSAHNNLNMDRVVCVNEKYFLKVILQNPYSVPLELRNIRVVTEYGFQIKTFFDLARVADQTNLESQKLTNGAGFPKSITRSRKPAGAEDDIKSPLPLTVHPDSVAEVILPFAALEVGTFVINGFDITTACLEEQFYPICERDNYTELQKLKISPSEYYIKVSSEGKFGVNLMKEIHSQKMLKKTVALTAVPMQPSLSLIENLITTGWAMLLEGEVQPHSILLRNTSSEVINYLSLSVWDSTIDIANSKLNMSSPQSAFTPDEYYEMEWSVLNEKAIVVTNKADIAANHKEVHSGDSVKLRLDLFGKRGMTELNLILEYGKRPQTEGVEMLVRKTTVPFHVTIHRSLDILNCDIISHIPTYQKVSSTGARHVASVMSHLRDLETFFAAGDCALDDFCVLAVDMKNSWKESLKISFEIDEFKLVTELEPEQTTRLFLPIRKIDFTDADLSLPIPSLRKKQYIKNYSLSDEMEAQIRRSHWARIKMLERLSALWSTIGGASPRHGQVNLRTIRLTPAMANRLIRESILITQHITTDCGDSVGFENEHNALHLQTEQMYVLRTVLVNNGPSAMSGTIRHMPFPVHALTKQDFAIDLKILYNGSLQVHVGQDKLGPHGRFETSISFVILEKGFYEWGCMFDVNSDHHDTVVKEEPICISAL